MADLCDLTGHELARKLAAGEISAIELVESAFRRVDAVEDELHAFLLLTRELAADQARSVDDSIRNGEGLSPLAGIPLALKDVLTTKGIRSTAGSKILEPYVPLYDCTPWVRLQEAGSVLIGKTNCDEFAMGSSNENSAYGPARNPWDLGRVPGGSSGGSAAAVAAGEAVWALGTDTGGSVRQPAALCGVVGLKPTYGLVSLRGVTPLSRSLDHGGPMANSVEDAFLLLEAISDFRRSAAPRPRILIPRSFFFDDVDPRIVELVREAASRLGETETLDAGNPEGTWDANTVILLSDAVAFHEQRLREHPDWFGGALAERMSRGFEIRGIDYARARDVQREWTEFLTALLGDHSVLAAPTTPIPATTIGDREGAELARVMTRLTAPFNLAGVPVLSLPIGKVDGLPVGMQLVAAPGRESLLWEAARETAPE